MVNGLTISSLKEYDHVCEGCVLGKSHHLPFPKASLTNYTPMELVVVDLTGPMSVETWSGMSYTFIAIEMNSWMSFGELLASTDKVAKTLKMIIVKLECQSGIKTKWIRSDNGTEFVNSVIYTFCKRNGILHKLQFPKPPSKMEWPNALSKHTLKWSDACSTQRKWTYDIGERHSSMPFTFATTPLPPQSWTKSLYMCGLAANPMSLTFVSSDLLHMPIFLKRSVKGSWK
jgi:hypothetical protein